MSLAALAADDEVFVATAPVDGVAEAEAAYTLGQEGSCLPTADGDELPKHTYPGAFHQFQSFPGGVMKGEGDQRGLFVRG